METAQQPESCTGWIRGWFLSPPVDMLFYETASPLTVELAVEPKTLTLRSPGMTSELSLAARGNATCVALASGVRIITDTPEGSKLFSCRQIDANTLVIEADDPQLSFASDGLVTESADKSTITASVRNQHILILVNWGAKPMRMVAISGTGDPGLLAIKGRRYLAESAHTLIDTLLREKALTPVESWDEVVVDPREYLNGRLRCASIHQPCPWVADAHEQPVTDPAILYLLVRALAPGEPDAAFGWITNTLENAGVDAPREDDPPPMLMQMIMSLRRITGMWPPAIEESLPAVDAHARAVLERHRGATGLARVIAARELQAWSSFYTASGFAEDDASASLRKQIRALTESTSDTSDPAWAILLIGTPRAFRPDQIQAALNELSRHLDDIDTPNRLHWACALMIEESSLMQLHGNLRFAWRKELIDRATGAWQQRVVAARERQCVDGHSDAIIVAALGLWAQRADAQNRKMSGKSGHSLLWMLNRNRRVLAIAAAAAALLFIGWLVSVQLRRSLPPSVMRTRIGIVQQHYATGAYAEALTGIAELETRGAFDPTVIWFLRGKIYYRQNVYDEAITWFSAVVDKQPGHAAARYNLGLSYFQHGEYARARAVFDAIAEEFKVTHPATVARARRASALTTMMLEKHPRGESEERGAPRRSG